ncbi:TIGR02450 family Trp-rich protein [Marinomonas algarum]|uniref:TIGR02450 family Trp-rich protein n=1 Tax=Marinomonas algarum TaxID=2883105 RepID=A0A9X1ILH9_9GAMM|nr:TIGR02450 family Trp-rich protein [Marinomonas algarum]MCB5161445.1 TIGR02450 family Trp-rich protein [Marinomonas algarum]
MTTTKPHRINPNKLLLSKWTSNSPQQKEKHFIVTKLHRDENEVVIACILEAVINKNQYQLPWQDLTSVENWQQGWK